MAIDILDEHEQGERVRKWLRENGSAIFGGIALGIALIFGWQWWQRAQAEQRVTAAVQYQALVEAAARNEPDTVAQLAATIEQDYADTPYAFFAALLRADLAIAGDDPEAAAAALERARTLAKDEAGQGLATLRLARAMLGQGQAEAALPLLDAPALESYAGAAAELRGDALVALGRNEDAREAYRKALQELDVGAPTRPIVEMKLADLGAGTDAEDA